MILISTVALKWILERTLICSQTCIGPCPHCPGALAYSVTECLLTNAESGNRPITAGALDKEIGQNIELNIELEFDKIAPHDALYLDPREQVTASLKHQASRPRIAETPRF